MLLPIILGIILASAIIAVTAWMTVDAKKRGRNTREAICRRTSFFCLYSGIAMVAELFAYATSKPLIVHDGKLQYNTSPIIVGVLAYGAIAACVVGGLSFLLAYRLRRRRIKLADKTHLDLFITLYREYGADEAHRIMRRAGHNATLDNERIHHDM